MYDQAFPGICQNTRDLQLQVKLEETLSGNVLDILLARDCHSFAEMVQVIYKYEQLHSTDHTRSPQVSAGAPGTTVHRWASELVQETDSRPSDNILLSPHQGSASKATPEEISAYQSMFKQILANQASEDSEPSDDSVADGMDTLLMAMGQAAKGDFWKTFASQMSQGQLKRQSNCFFCNKTGHRWLTCSLLWDVLQGNGYKPRDNQSPNEVSKPSRTPTDQDQLNFQGLVWPTTCQTQFLTILTP